MNWLLSPYRERRTYTMLGYLAASFALGVAGFTVTVTLFSVGLGMGVTLLGIPILVVAFTFVAAYADLHRRLAESLLGARLPARRRPMLPRGLWWDALRRRAGQPGMAREVGFVVTSFVVGIANLVVTATLLGLMFGGFAQPILQLAGVDQQIGSWQIDTFAESLVGVPVSVVFVLIGARLMRGWGHLNAGFITHSLGHLDRRELRHAIRDTLAATPGLGGFEICDALRHRFGAGPWVTPLRVDAALIVLESTGQIEAERTGEPVRYHPSDRTDARPPAFTAQ